MTSTLFDDDVRLRITTSGLGETLFVEAGAGTGKTSQLVGRVVNLVVDGGIALRHVAAITFTEAAASELRDRIRAALEAEAAGADVHRAARCREAIADVDRVAITTLHGFALRILSEHPFVAGLPPRLHVADEITSQLAFEQRWERFVNALYDDPDEQRLLARARQMSIPLEHRYVGQATLKDVAAQLNQSWDRAQAIAGMPLPELTTPDLRPLLAALDAVRAVRHHCRHDDGLAVHIDEMLGALDGIVVGDDPAEALLAIDRRWHSRIGRKEHWAVPVAGVRVLIDDVDAALSAVKARASAEVLGRFKVLIAREVLAGAEARRREGLLEFHDLLVLALTALRASPSMRASLGQRYQRLLLDEFQDTDPIQIELAVLIASAIEGRPPTWQHVDVGKGRLFFVGDPKQSIYRFRRADIGLFLEARDRFGGTAGPLRLTTNFRSVPPILEWVNELFGVLMPVERPGSQPRYEPLFAHRSGSPGADHRVVLLGGASEGRAAEIRTLEAIDVANVIAEIRDRGDLWPVEDRGAWRPARLSDVTVLVPTRTSLPYLRAQLDAREIPFRLDTGTLVFATQEIRDVMSAVRAVDDPSNEIAVVAALRSPLYACSDVDLFEYRRARGSWDVSRQPPAELAEQPVGSAMAHLHELWSERWWMSPSDLVERIMRERGAMLAAFGAERPREVWRRLRFLLDQARAFESGGGGGLRAFTEWAELQRSSSSRAHEPLPADTDDDAVRVMTIHGAKGLEFPIAILSGMTTAPVGRASGVRATWNGDDLEIRVGKEHRTEQFDARAVVDEQMDGDERLRLLYVAATRARDHLVVSCHHMKDKLSHGAEVFRVMGTAERAPIHRPHGDELPIRSVEVVDDGSVAVTVGPPAPGAAERDAWIAARRALLAGAARRRFTSATAIASEVAAAESQEPAEEAAATDAEFDVDAFDGAGTEVSGGDHSITWRRGRAGTAIGRAVHATLQSIDLATVPDHEAIEAIARREAGIEALPEAADTVAAMVRSALRSDALQLARRHPHHKELYVAAPIGGRVIEGYIDLLVETPEGLVVVDYKTDSVRSEAEVDAKLARYELQGAAYVVALEHTTGMPVVDCRFVFCRPSGAIERAVADLHAARRQVRLALGPAP